MRIRTTPTDLDVLPARQFGEELRRARERLSWSQQTLAERLGCSDALVGAIENAYRVPTVALAANCDRILHTDGYLERLCQLVRAFGTPDAPLAELLPAATSLRMSDPLTVPALAQTKDYARATYQAAHLSADRVEQLLTRRIRLRDLLETSDTLRGWLILDETSLYRPVGSAEILSQQLKELLALAGTGRVVIQVLRTTNTVTTLLRVPQILITLEDGTDLAHLPNASPDDMTERYGEPDHHTRAYDLLRAAARPPQHSLVMIRDASR